MQTLYVDDVAKASISKWLEAKANADGWQAVKKEAEAELSSKYKADFERLVDSLNDTTNLTATVALGEELKVSIGNTLEIDQPAAVEFLLKYPAMLGVLFKVEHKPISSAVVLTKLGVQDEIGMALAKVIEFKPKSNSFSQK